MARKSSSGTPPPKAPAILTMPRETARARLAERIELGRRLVAPSSNPIAAAVLSESEYDKWNQYNHDMLGRMFSTDDYAREYDWAAVGAVRLGPAFGNHYHEDWHPKAEARIKLLESIVDRLELIGEPASAALPERRATNEPRAGASGDVFIVHGHDSPAKNEVALFVQQAGLHAVILHQQPNAGRTIIEKFEDHGSAVSFAIILLTPDDIGGPAPFSTDKLHSRARQNVIAEMGWFAGKLGRSRVCVLKKGDVEVPSDFAGVGYTEMDDRGAWKMELGKELKTAGYTIDWAKALA